MNPEQRPSTYPVVETFPDGRKPLHELYDVYFQLLDHGWTAECIAVQEYTNPDGKTHTLPIYGFLSPKKTSEPEPACWTIADIHGEEPAPVQASADEIETIQALPEQGIPVVAIFVANPAGYCRDFRYIDKRRSPIIGRPGKSVGDAEHLLPHIPNKHLPRKQHPSSPIADALTSWVLKKSALYYPLFVANHHEDEIDFFHLHHDRRYYYNYVYGNPLVLDQITPTIKHTLEQSGHTLQKKGRTRHGNLIINGFVHNVHDGSIDELLASPTYFIDGQQYHKKPALAVVTIETIIDPKKKQTMKERARIHRDIIQQYSFLYHAVHNFSLNSVVGI
jgi:hypothetical protein